MLENPPKVMLQFNFHLKYRNQHEALLYNIAEKISHNFVGAC